MEKKVLTLLLGSPRIGGNTEALADALAEGAREKGYEIRKVHLATMNLKGCIDCRKCWSLGKPCIQNDDMDQVYPDIEDASIVVFVSPLYFYSWTTQIKPVWDRLLPYFMPGAKRTVPAKKTILLAAAGDAEDECFEGMKASFKLGAGFVGWEIIGQICAIDVYAKGDMQSKGVEYLQKAVELGRSL
ncbi:flavodoxin family protein [Synergistaceae bacterium OttesenSCG-928-D05]|nr:flavodoxin family protein [Synergistaceae bacterium OttesenSCG-928-D05]